jgi:putative transposase
VRSNEYSVRLSYVDRNELLSVKRQCQLLAVNRSTVYYKPVGESEFNLKIMLEIDKKLTETPEYGSRTLADILSMECGIPVNRKRIQRLMRIMGVEAVYPKKRTTFPGNTSYIYPYLLKDLKINRPNQVWCTDITYLPMRGGYMYLVAIMDWYSRRILSWELSNTLDPDFCIEALNKAVEKTGNIPEIVNSDQGAQFTSKPWVTCLEELGIKISMDGKGRWVDNVMIERFWRTLKHNDIYLKLYDSVPDLEKGICSFIDRYNRLRPHSSLGRRITPDMAYYKQTIIYMKQTG